MSVIYKCSLYLLGACMLQTNIGVAGFLHRSLTARLNTFFKKLKRNYYRQKLGRLPTEYEHDVYLSYDRSDREFVFNTLSDVLEDVYGIRCCIPDRDFSIDGILVEDISYFISKSQMSIIVLSERSLLNPIQFMERNIARHTELQTFLRHKVIYIYLDGVAESDDSSVRRIVGTNVGLKYIDNENSDWEVAFFEKLSGKIYKSLSQSQQI